MDVPNPLLRRDTVRTRKPSGANYIKLYMKRANPGLFFLYHLSFQQQFNR